MSNAPEYAEKLENDIARAAEQLRVECGQLHNERFWLTGEIKRLEAENTTIRTRLDRAEAAPAPEPAKPPVCDWCGEARPHNAKFLCPRCSKTAYGDEFAAPNPLDAGIEAAIGECTGLPRTLLPNIIRSAAEQERLRGMRESAAVLGRLADFLSAHIAGTEPKPAPVPFHWCSTCRFEEHRPCRGCVRGTPDVGVAEDLWEPKPAPEPAKCCECHGPLTGDGIACAKCIAAKAEAARVTRLRERLKRCDAVRMKGGVSALVTRGPVVGEDGVIVLTPSGEESRVSISDIARILVPEPEEESSGG